MSVLTGRGTLFDQTPPNPGYLENVIMDRWAHERCEDFTPKFYRSRCVGRRPLTTTGE